MSGTWSASDRLREALHVLTPVLDIVDGPVEDAEPPAWCARRGWAEFLLSLGVAAPLAAGAARVVDVGAGSGHLARLCAELFQRETLAVERDGLRLRMARRRTKQRAQDVGALAVRFTAADVGPDRLELERSDLAVGLHACGELGDRLVLAAAARCDLLLCSCCFQKVRPPERAMLSVAGGTLALKKPVLGLANLTSQAAGVEASLGDNLRGRCRHNGSTR